MHYQPDVGNEKNEKTEFGNEKKTLPTYPAGSLNLSI
jgi:hypothetical protein